MFVIPKSVKGRSVPSVLFPLSFVALLAGHAGAVGTRHFVIEGQEDFKKGELDGVSVDSSGQVRPGLSLGDVALAGAGSSWDAIEYEGGLLIATGNEGKLFSVEAGKTKELARTKAMAITSLVRAFVDRIIAGTIPGHQLYELKVDELV